MSPLVFSLVPRSPPLDAGRPLSDHPFPGQAPSPVVAPALLSGTDFVREFSMFAAFAPVTGRSARSR